MSTVQDYGFQPSVFEDSGQNFDLSHIIGIIRRRALYFAIPFLLILMAGVAVIEMQRPIYLSQGEILVEFPAIPPALVHPTITELPDQRFEVIRQRILAEGNLLAVVNKYNLFPEARQSLPPYKLLEFMRKSVEITPMPLAMSLPGSSTTAFMVGFYYDLPSVALKVANEFINQILSQDTSRRTNAATEAAKFLEQEVKRLEQAHDAVVAQMEAIKQRPPDTSETLSEEVKADLKVLADLEAELVQKSAIYSDEYPIIKELKRKIAALKRKIATEPQAVAIADQTDKPNVTMQVLQQQEINLQKNLDEANQKLAAARLGETMEKNSEAEHLQLIASPDLPHDPVAPKKLKWFAVALVLAGMVGAGTVFAGEMLDGSIHRKSELAGIVDPRLIVTLPYLLSPGEQYRKRRNFVLLCVLLVAVLATGIGIAVAKGVSVNFDLRWIDVITSLIH